MKASKRKELEYLIQLITTGKLRLDDDGKIYKVGKNGTFRGENLTGYGYYRVSVYIGNYEYIHCDSHRLIYAYHHGLDSLKDGFVINHIDYNKTNNRINNLEQITRMKNSSLGNGTNKSRIQ